MRLAERAGTALILLALGAFGAPFVSKPGSVLAAEISCVQTAGHIDEEAAQKNWPGGYRTKPETCRALYINGQIAKGDFAKLADLYRRNHPALNSIYLNSPGGDALEAMKIGDLIRQYLIYTHAPFRFAPGGTPMMHLYNGSDTVQWLCQGPSCKCASACALVWFAAVNRTGEVGLHRPRLDDASFKDLPPSEAAKVYRQVLEEIARYLRRMEVPQAVADLIITTNSAEIMWVGTVEAEGDKWNLQESPSYSEWQQANCGSVTSKEEDTMIQLGVKKDHEPLKSEEKMLLTSLYEKSERVLRCNSLLRSRSVEKLPSP